jgi:hypothetical protein
VSGPASTPPPLPALAEARGLTRAAALLTSAKTAPLFDNSRVPLDPRLVEPPHDRPKSILGQMARRGLDPALVQALWATLADRPLERALLAWDVLTTALLPERPDDPFVAELRAAARLLLPALPRPPRAGLDLNLFSSVRLIAECGGGGAAAPQSGIEELVAAYDFSLAVLARLVRDGDPLVRSPAVLSSLHAYAKLLQLAHLPTLAAVYFDYLSTALGQRPAALDLCETLFDAEAPTFIPGDAIRKGDVPDAEINDVAEYLVYRSYLALGDAGQAHQLLESNLKQRDPALGPPSPRLQVVRAHLGTLMRRRVVPLEVVERAIAAEPLWRYGARARVTVAAAQLPATSRRPLQLWHDYVTGFGNDFRCWYDALAAAPASAGWRQESCAVLAREARHLPHDVAAWRAILMTLGSAVEVQRAVQELEQRLAGQCQLT